MNKKMQIAGVFALLSLLIPSVHAQASVSVHQMAQKEIDLNGQSLSKPYGFAYDNTAYMPIWYVMSALKHLGIQSKWDGRNWSITTPASEQPSLTNIGIGSGSMNIYVNGKMVKKVVGVANVDPSSKNMTMFMPVWYVMQILKAVSVNPTWDGTTWSMETNNNLTDYAPEDIVYLVDKDTTNLEANGEPIQVAKDFYQSGFVLNSFVNEIQQEETLTKETWAQSTAKYHITKETFGDSSFNITQEGNVNSNKMVIEVSETDSYTYTNGTTQPFTEVNDWILQKDSLSGLWQIAGIYGVSITPIKDMNGNVINSGYTFPSLFKQSASTNQSTSSNQPSTNQSNATSGTASSGN